jgi:hypothetical protein
MARKRTEPKPPHERYNPAHPLLRELVLVNVDVGNGTSFDVLLTRVPSVGEEITREGDEYRLTRVQHYPVDDDGRAYLGYHAFVFAELLPQDDEPTPKRKRSRKKPSR